MTPGETVNRVDAWTWKEKRRYEFGAWMLAHLLSPHSKKPLTPQQFLGGPTKEEKVEELIRRLEKRA